MSKPRGLDIAGALGQIPCGLFLMTAAHDEQRSGILVRWVQRCSANPPLVMVALAKGQRVEPLIRDSRCFALCQISAEDRFLYRKFATSEAELDDDSFVSLMSRCAPSGAPIIERALSYLDCELVRHVDLDSDHRIYVGQVHHAAILTDTKPAVLFGENGVKH